VVWVGEVSGLADAGCPDGFVLLLDDLGGDGNLPLRTLLPTTLVPGDPLTVPAPLLPELAPIGTPVLFTEEVAPKEFLVLLGPASPGTRAAMWPIPVPGVPGLERSSTEFLSLSARSERCSQETGVPVEVGISFP